MEDVLRVEDLRKTYGDHEAVKGISFSIREGEVFGLIGPNGAGKTTTLRMICTLLTPSGGHIRICGHDTVTDGPEVRKIISYLPEDAGAYKDLTGRQYIRFAAGFFADGEEFEEMGARGIEMANLGDRIDSKIDAYSKGMMRRLLISRAVLPKPKLAVMDEITSGLDVMNAYRTRLQVRGLVDQGVTVLISSHNMFEVESLCDRVALINKGEIILCGTPQELMEQTDSKNLEEVFIKTVGADFDLEESK
jgi:ABC-2 type transport system ATP-binding protein